MKARSRPGGLNLGLERLNATVWWQGKSGMVVSQLEGHLKRLKKYEDPPDYLLIHVGCNDIGNIKVGHLRNDIKNILQKLSKDMPSTKIIWSQMLPRIKWRYSLNNAAMEKARRRVNNSIASHVLKSGGFYIRYPDILGKEIFFKEDGVHLSDVGNNIFINTLQGGIEEFLSSSQTGIVFPKF